MMKQPCKVIAVKQRLSSCRTTTNLSCCTLDPQPHPPRNCSNMAFPLIWISRSSRASITSSTGICLSPIWSSTHRNRTSRRSDWRRARTWSWVPPRHQCTSWTPWFKSRRMSRSWIVFRVPSRKRYYCRVECLWRTRGCCSTHNSTPTTYSLVIRHSTYPRETSRRFRSEPRPTSLTIPYKSPLRKVHTHTSCRNAILHVILCTWSSLRPHHQGVRSQRATRAAHQGEWWGHWYRRCGTHCLLRRSDAVDGGNSLIVTFHKKERALRILVLIPENPKIFVKDFLFPLKSINVRKFFKLILSDG